MRKGRTTTLGLALAVGCAPLLLAGCIVPSPSPGRIAQLNSVAAINSTNAYAAGSFVDSTGAHDLMEHWDGKSWQEVFLPPPFGTGLGAITAVNASNIWAVSNRRTLHFDGTSWRSLPNPAGVAMLNVASAPDGSVYGYGTSNETNHGTNNPTYTLFVMTAGGWHLTSPVPTVGPECSVLYTTGLTVVKADDVWAVGNGTNCAALLHWTGDRWQQSPPVSTTGVARLYAVSARSDDDVWAVGARITQSGQHGNSLVIHYNGARVASVPTVDTTGSGYLYGVDATAEGVWAVGAAPEGTESENMLIKKLTGNQMVDQSVEQPPIVPPTGPLAELRGVSVVDGAVTSVGSYDPSFGESTTLTDRRNAN